MASTRAAPGRSSRAPSQADRDDGLGAPVAVPRGSRRARIRSKPGLGQAYRVGVFVAGLLCIALGVALAVLPGPLTIPPVLLGLWIWSTEFAGRGASPAGRVKHVCHAQTAPRRRWLSFSS